MNLKSFLIICIFLIAIGVQYVDCNCKSYDFYYNEGPTKNRCHWWNDCLCDGARTCSFWQYCEGTSRPAYYVKPSPPPPVNCVTESYYRDESQNSMGSNRCTNNCECDGMRTCSPYNYCQGTSRQPVNPPPPPPPPVYSCQDYRYVWNEQNNKNGPGFCESDCECQGARLCVECSGDLCDHFKHCQ